MLVKNWMTKDVITIAADQSMQDAIYRLKEHRINVLPVMDGGKLVGVVTDRDLKKASASEATTLDVHELIYLISKIQVKDIMSAKPVTIPPDYTVEEAAATLLERRISSLPVTDATGRLVGIITRSDLFRVIIELSGFGQRGLQFAMCLKDEPGTIKAVRELIRKYKARTASILSSSEHPPPGHLNVYFRIFDLERDQLGPFLAEAKNTGTLLYVVDHRENKRIIVQNS